MPRLSEVRHSKANRCDFCIQPIGETFDGRGTEQFADKRPAAPRAIHCDAKSRLKMRSMSLGGSS